MIYLDVTDSCRSPLNTGIQRVVRGFFRGLRDAQFAVTPILWEPALDTYSTLSRREKGFLEAPFGGPTGRKPLVQPTRTLFPAWTRFVRRMVHRRNRIDLAAVLKRDDKLIVPQIYRDRRGEFVGRLGNHSKARRIAFFYDAIPWRRPDVTAQSNVNGVVEYMMSLAAFELIITSSREAMDDLRDCWKMGKAAKMPPIKVSAWPLDDSFFSPQRSRGITADKPKQILCVGTLEQRKNHLTLLAAAEKLWSDGLRFELEFIGRTSREWGARVIAEVERLRNSGRPVKWHRHVDNDFVLKAYDECALTVFPSFIEGYGLPIAESLARAKPCICGGNGALGEVANGGGCVIVDQTDAEAIATGMRRLLTDDAFYKELCAQARERKFENWSAFVAKVAPLL